MNMSEDAEVPPEYTRETIKTAKVSQSKKDRLVAVGKRGAKIALLTGRLLVGPVDDVAAIGAQVVNPGGGKEQAGLVLPSKIQIPDRRHIEKKLDSDEESKNRQAVAARKTLSRQFPDARQRIPRPTISNRPLARSMRR